MWAREAETGTDTVAETQTQGDSEKAFVHASNFEDFAIC